MPPKPRPKPLSQEPWKLIPGNRLPGLVHQLHHEPQVMHREQMRPGSLLPRNVMQHRARHAHPGMRTGSADGAAAAGRDGDEGASVGGAAEVEGPGRGQGCAEAGGAGGVGRVEDVDAECD